MDCEKEKKKEEKIRNKPIGKCVISPLLSSSARTLPLINSYNFMAWRLPFF